MLTAALRTTKIAQKHMPSINYSYTERHVTTMLSIPTKWRRNAMTIDTTEITTSPHVV